MIWRAISFLLSAATLACVVCSARACTCSQSSPGTCPGLQAGDVVFMGTVTEMQDMPYVAPAAPASDSSGNQPSSGSQTAADARPAASEPEASALTQSAPPAAPTPA